MSTKSYSPLTSIEKHINEESSTQFQPLANSALNNVQMPVNYEKKRTLQEFSNKFGKKVESQSNSRNNFLRRGKSFGYNVAGKLENSDKVKSTSNTSQHPSALFDADKHNLSTTDSSPNNFETLRGSIEMGDLPDHKQNINNSVSGSALKEAQKMFGNFIENEKPEEPEDDYEDEDEDDDDDEGLVISKSWSWHPSALLDADKHNLSTIDSSSNYSEKQRELEVLNNMLNEMASFDENNKNENTHLVSDSDSRKTRLFAQPKEEIVQKYSNDVVQTERQKFDRFNEVQSHTENKDPGSSGRRVISRIKRWIDKLRNKLSLSQLKNDSDNERQEFWNSFRRNDKK